MLLKIKTLFSKKNIKKLLRSTLCLLLCVLTVVFFGGVLAPTQAHAVAGIDDVIVFVIGIMVACGVTFSSSAVAQSTAQRFYNSADTETKDIIDKAYEQYEAKKEYYTTTTYGLIICLANEWQHIFDAIAAFIYTPAVITTSTYIDFNISSTTMQQYDNFVSLLQSEGNLTFNYDFNPHAYSSFIVGSTMIEIIGIEECSNVPSDVYSAFSKYSCIFKVSILGTGYTYFTGIPCNCIKDSGIIYYNDTLTFSLSNDAIYWNTQYYSSKPLIRPYFYQIPSASPYGGFLYYGNHLVTAVGTEFQYSLNIDSIGSIVCDDGTIFGTDYAIPCDADRITDDILTRTFTCDPSISIGNEYIGTDTTWTDSIADAGSGSIAFPLDVDDLIDSSASDVRDKTLTDTGDIATDKPTTGENTETDSDKKPNKPSIPGLSLSEILFKEKFPFCLPWDIYNLFVGLQAEEEAPRFVVPFKFERLGINEEIVIDFGDYEEQIKIIRFFIGAMFVFALIMISRKIIGAQ